MISPLRCTRTSLKTSGKVMGGSIDAPSCVTSCRLASSRNAPSRAYPRETTAIVSAPSTRVPAKISVTPGMSVVFSSSAITVPLVTPGGEPSSGVKVTVTAPALVESTV